MPRFYRLSTWHLRPQKAAKSPSQLPCPASFFTLKGINKPIVQNFAQLGPHLIGCSQRLAVEVVMPDSERVWFLLFPAVGRVASGLLPPALLSNSSEISPIRRRARSFSSAHDGTQKDVAGVLGWSISKVKDYSALKKICGEAWEEIVATFCDVEKSHGNNDATGKVAIATFTEGLLRPIIPLTPEQQLQLVSDLVHEDKNKRITKNRFKLQTPNSWPSNMRGAVGVE